MPMAEASPQEHWAAFYRAQRRALGLYALALTGNSADAEDLLHDVLVRMVRENPPARDARAYVMRCVRNAAIDRRRRAATRVAPATLADDGLAFLDVDGAHARVGDSQQTAPGSAEVRETRDAVYAALARLPEQRREVIILKIYAELGFREIAEILAAPLGTVTSHYARGLDELRSVLSPEVAHV